MTDQERVKIIEAEFRAVGWNPAETPTLDDSGNLRGLNPFKTKRETWQTS